MSVIASIWSPHSASFASHSNHSEAHHFHLPNAFHTQPKHHPREYYVPYGPDSDIRETKDAYQIEMEVAGTTNKDDVLIQWMSPRTLVVEGTAKRPNVGRQAGGTGEALFPQDGSKGNTSKKTDEAINGGDGGALEKYPDEEDDYVVGILLAERKVGAWHRSFTLPANVDMKALKAKLEGGLLTITLPKRDLTNEPRVKIEVE